MVDSLTFVRLFRQFFQFLLDRHNPRMLFAVAFEEQ